MADQFDALTDEMISWIAQQHVFFVASAGSTGRVNLSPKGQDSMRVINGRELLWLNLTGSGNETAAHLLDSNRLTIMWCAFAGPPRILRVYGNAETIHPRDEAWQACAQLMPPPLGARQYYKVHIDMAQTSCGFAVPFMEYGEDRQALDKWTEKRGEQGITDYWQEKNVVSLDGLPTGIFE